MGVEFHHNPGAPRLIFLLTWCQNLEASSGSRTARGPQVPVAMPTFRYLSDPYVQQATTMRKFDFSDHCGRFRIVQSSPSASLLWAMTRPSTLFVAAQRDA
jgi:hypothetical protein